MSNPNFSFFKKEEYISISNKIDINFSQKIDDQIKKDIFRSNVRFENFEEIKASDYLYRILKVIAIIDPELGYCQGMNIVVAKFLLISDFNELETFNMIYYLLKIYDTREFYINGFPKLYKFMFILKGLIKNLFPDIYNTLIKLEVGDELWIFKWVQTLFFLTLPVSISVRLIDCILCYGLEFIFNFGLSFLKEYEKRILKCNELIKFLDLFRAVELENINILEKFNNKKELNFVDYEEFYINKSKEIYKNLKFSNDFIFFREKIIRDAKDFNIKDEINKISKNYTTKNNFNLNISKEKFEKNVDVDSKLKMNVKSKIFETKNSNILLNYSKINQEILYKEKKEDFNNPETLVLIDVFNDLDKKEIEENENKSFNSRNVNKISVINTKDK